MILSQQVTIYYVDGSSKDVNIDQWSLSQFAAYATKMGWPTDPDRIGLLGITMLRFQAWAQLHRDATGTRPSFDTWDRTVVEVVAEKSEEVDPTQPGLLEGSSPQ